MLFCLGLFERNNRYMVSFFIKKMYVNITLLIKQRKLDLSVICENNLIIMIEAMEGFYDKKP